MKHTNPLAPIRIASSGLPEREHAIARQIELNSLLMVGAVQEFGHTAELYLFAHERKLAAQDRSPMDEMFQMITWIKIAGRNGAIVVYGIAAAMDEINSLKAPQLWKRVDLPRRKNARKRLDQEFPAISNIRHSAAHPQELSANETEQAKHTMSGSPVPWIISAGSVLMQDGMTAYTDALEYSATFKGKCASYVLSLSKANALHGIVGEYNAAFALLENAAET